MSASYFRLTLKQVPAHQEEALTDLVFAFGASGTAENLKFIQPDLEYNPQIIEQDFICMDVFFEKTPNAQLLDQLKAHFPGVQIDLSEEESKDWLAEWKKGFTAFELVPEIWVVPSWLQAPKVAKKIIKMDPGLAFGTGTHETTQLAAQLIQLQMFRKKIETMIDVGTGTGILAILAEHLGVDSAHAMDVDPEAVRVAKENCQINSTQVVRVREELVADIKDSYDLVVANIIDGVLIKIQRELKRLMKSEGTLILSGILCEHEADFIKQFQLPGTYKWSARVSRNEWLALMAEKA